MSNEFKTSPKLEFDKSAIKPSLKYRIDVDTEKAGDLLRYLGLSDEIIAESKILITDKMSRLHAGNYNHNTKTIKIKSSLGYNIYKDLTGFRGIMYNISRENAYASANKSLNNTFLHEAYHMYDFHTNIKPEDWLHQNNQNSKMGCLAMMASTLLASSSVQLLETIGLRSNIACIDTPAVFLSGFIGLAVASNISHNKYYKDDPIEISAREFAERYKNDQRWKNIVSFSFRKQNE